MPSRQPLWSPERLLTAGTISLVLLAWFGVTEAKLVPPVLVPSPQKVVQALLEILRDGYKGRSLVEHLGASLGRLLGSFGLVLVTAIPLGLLSGLNSRVRAVLDPLVEFYRPLPPLAYYTVLVLWLGIDDTSKMALLYLGTAAQPGPFAATLKSTADFLVDQKAIPTAPDQKGFETAIDTSFVEAALK